jgi:hypothetical protein
MPDHPNITPELLRQLLRYEPDTGKLFWLPRPMEMFTSDSASKIWNARLSGVEAITTHDRDGYKKGKVLMASVMAHRMAWILSYGEIPSNMQIDHKNGVRDDNRLINLRLATKSENSANRAKPSSNTTGVKGVDWHSKSKKWRARITVNNMRREIGFFCSIADAEAAYLAAAEEHKGQFAYHKRAAQ